MVLGLGITPNHVELHDDGIGCRLFQRDGDAVVGIRQFRLHVLAHKDGFGTVLFQIDGGTVYLLAAEFPKALWRTCETGDGEHHTSQQRVGHFQIPVVLDMTHGEETIPHAALFLHYLVVGVVVVGDGGVLTTLVFLLFHFGGVDLCGLYLCGVTLDRLHLRGVRVVNYCKRRLLSHQEKHNDDDSLNGFVGTIRFHRCKVTFFLPI